MEIKSESFLVKPWHACTTRFGVARTSISLSPSGSFLITMKSGQLINDHGLPYHVEDHASAIAQYLDGAGLGDADIYSASQHFMAGVLSLPKDFLKTVAETHIVFSQKSDGELIEAERRVAKPLELETV